MTEKTEGAEDYEKTLDVCSVKFAEDAERNEEIFRGVICTGGRICAGSTGRSQRWSGQKLSVSCQPLIPSALPPEFRVASPESRP